MTQAFNLSQFANKVNTSGQASLTTAVTGTLPVANGGTNQTTYTNGQLLIGNTTGNTLAKATLTAGTGISVTNGSGSITIASTASGGFNTIQSFTSPGTFTTPATTTKVRVTVVGGGGGGFAPGPNGGFPPVVFAGAGGGGGGSALGIYTVTASTPYAVTIGSGGTNGAPLSVAATAGGSSSFSTLVSATGGTAATTTQGSGGTGTSGNANFPGGQGSGSGSTATGATGGVSGIGTNYGTGGQGRFPGSGIGGLVIVEY